MNAAIPELDDLFSKVGKDRLLAFLSGEPVEDGAEAPEDGGMIVEMTGEDVKALREFVERERAYVPPGPEDCLADGTIMRLLRAECPPEWSDGACRNWLDGRLLEFAVEQVAEYGGDVRRYAETTGYNILRVLSGVRRQRVDFLSPEERELRLILALPERIVPRYASNRQMPEARR